MVSKTTTYDWNTIVALIALVISITTPALSLFLSNIHQRKLKKLDLKHSLKLESYHRMEKTFSNFISNVSTMNHIATSNLKEYEIAYHKLFLYVPKEYWHSLEEFNNLVISSDASNASVQKHYLEITEILASLLQETQKQIPT